MRENSRIVVVCIAVLRLARTQYTPTNNLDTNSETKAVPSQGAGKAPQLAYCTHIVLSLH